MTGVVRVEIDISHVFVAFGASSRVFAVGSPGKVDEAEG